MLKNISVLSTTMFTAVIFKQFLWPINVYTATRLMHCWRPWLVSKWVTAHRSWGERGGMSASKVAFITCLPFHPSQWATVAQRCCRTPPIITPPYTHCTSKWRLQYLFGTVAWLYTNTSTLLSRVMPSRTKWQHSVCPTSKQIHLCESQLAIPEAVIVAYLTFISCVRSYFYPRPVFSSRLHHCHNVQQGCETALNAVCSLGSCQLLA
jgi:hypothetical protein